MVASPRYGVRVKRITQFGSQLRSPSAVLERRVAAEVERTVDRAGALGAHERTGP